MYKSFEGKAIYIGKQGANSPAPEKIETKSEVLTAKKKKKNVNGIKFKGSRV